MENYLENKRVFVNTITSYAIKLRSQRSPKSATRDQDRFSAPQLQSVKNFAIIKTLLFCFLLAWLGLEYSLPVGEMLKKRIKLFRLAIILSIACAIERAKRRTGGKVNYNHPIINRNTFICW